MEYWKARHIAGFASKEFRWTPASNKKESAFKRRRPMPSVGYNKIPDTGYRIPDTGYRIPDTGYQLRLVR